MEDLDGIDKALLSKLQSNAKLTIKELAAELGLTISPIHERIKRLENLGFIKNYVAVLNKDLLKKSITSICQVTVEYHNDDFIEKFESQIVKLNEVQSCFHVTGAADFYLKINVDSLDEYHSFIRHKLSKLENIKTLNSTIVLKEIKNEIGFDI